jgi:hypothetical protein
MATFRTVWPMLAVVGSLVALAFVDVITRPLPAGTPAGLRVAAGGLISASLAGVAAIGSFRRLSKRDRNRGGWIACLIVAIIAGLMAAGLVVSAIAWVLLAG